MNTQAARTAEWLRACRGAETQERLAQDISDVTGWKITRDRYSKYESGSLPIGRVVLQHFVDYWATRGVGGPESLPTPAEEPTLIAALNRQSAAIESLVAEIRQEREDGRDIATAFDRAAMALLQALRPQDNGASTGQPVPNGTAG